MNCLNWKPYGNNKIENIFVIGGCNVYKSAMKYTNYVDKIYLTKVWCSGNTNVKFDTYFKIDLNNFDEEMLSERKKTNNSSNKENSTSKSKDTDNIEYQFCVLTPKVNDDEDGKTNTELNIYTYIIYTFIDIYITLFQYIIFYFLGINRIFQLN